MSPGLSSIVDLIDCFEDGQKLLINDSMWSVLLKKFEDSKNFQSRPAYSKARSCWMLISSYAAATKNLDKSKKYLSSIIGHTTDNYQLKIYKIFEFILNLYEENSYLFEQHSESKNTEYDYVGAVWAPLFRKIIYLNNNMIRLKMGETVNPISTRGKNIQCQSKNNIALKMDYRFIVESMGRK